MLVKRSSLVKVVADADVVFTDFVIADTVITNLATADDGAIGILTTNTAVAGTAITAGVGARWSTNE